MQYEIKLSNFEGPLDMLLHLISKAKIEPKDIFVSEITEQYLSYMVQSEFLDLERASDFLQMAATLIYIKSRALLPAGRADEDLDENGLTPEEQLVARLSEYRRYKAVSEELKILEKESQGQFFRLPEELVAPEGQVPEFLNASVDALMAAYLRALHKAKQKRAQNEPSHVIIERDSISLRGQIRTILARLTIKPNLCFEELLSNAPSRMEIAVTFLALLELLHQGKLYISQEQAFGEIRISKKEKAVAK